MRLKALAGAILAATSVSTLAADGEDFYVSGSAMYLNSDESRSLDGSVFGAIGIGWWLTDKIGLELEYNDYDLELVDTPAEVDIDGFNVQGKYYFRTSMQASPYLGLGVGQLDSTSPFGSGSDDMVDVLAGFHYPLSDRVAGEIEWRYRFDGDDDSVPGADDFEDWIISLGITVALGPRYREEAPKPAPAPTPVEPAPKDSDGDGVMDPRDRCPGTPAGTPVDANGCALDTDGDRIADPADECPDTPRGNVVGEDGCDKDVIIELSGVFFGFDQATIRPEASATLDEGVRVLKDYPDVGVEIAGHTDSKGSETYNQQLSEKRAEAVRDYLVSKGIDADRLTVTGYGESRPIGDNSTEEGRARNRRVELRPKNRKVQ